MDALLLAVGQSLPELGGVGVVVLVLVLLLRRESSTETRHAALITRLGRTHDEELAEKRTEIAELRIELKQAQTELDAERRARRAAEDRKDAP